jgi:hypothetical protein
MEVMTNKLVEELRQAYTQSYQLCDSLQIERVIGTVRIKAIQARNDLYVAYQHAQERLKDGV